MIDLVAMKAWTYRGDGSGKATETAIPPHLTDAATAGRDALIEMVAEADDALMEKFFEAGTLTQDELVAGLHAATLNGRVSPLVCASSLLNIGAQQLLEAIANYLPSPAERPFAAKDTKQNADITAPPNATDPYAAFVWKTVADPFAGRITLFRVMTGTLKSDATVHNLTRDTSERLGHLTVMQGKTPTTVPELKAGDLGAVAKLKDTLTNDVLAEKGGLTFAPIAFIEPVLSYAIEPKSRGDEDKISTAMHRLEEEDPTIRYARDPQTKELLLSGQGQLHIEVTVAKLKRRFGVEVEPEAAADSVPRDDHRVSRGPRPTQEADRRTRAVRRLQNPHGAAATWQRLHFRRRHLRRVDPAAVRASGRKRDPGRPDARLPRRLSRCGLQGHGL